MLNRKKGELLQNKLNELISFKTKLTSENIDEFNVLKKEILNLLNDNQKLSGKIGITDAIYRF